MISPGAYDRLGQLAWVHAPQDEPADDTRIGRYRIVERIGAGSAGVVFHAVDPEGHAVAVKLLRRRRMNQRARRELELLERIAEREGVVALLDAGRCARGPFLVLELAEGGSLRRRLSQGGPLAWLPATELVTEIARPLGGLHADGIIHRDLKPENILLRADGRPVLSDFGLAKDLGDEDGDLTAAGFALGTIGYMAPELLDGNRELLGPWTDVFALGALLFELVAGAPPFQGQTLNEAARAIREDAVPDLPGSPRALRAIIRRCLAKDPGARYRCGRELTAALEEVLAAARRGEEAER